MSVLTHLTHCATESRVAEQERLRIDRSIINLRAKLVAHFGTMIKDHFRFGSTIRGTNLPRTLHDASDVDYMVVFRDDDKTPQTYLERLRGFASTHFPRSSVRQDHPTMVVELTHINFDLVPAIQNWWSGIQIPDKQGNWQSTDPHGFNEQLTTRNAECGNLLKPAIRIVKRWNVANGYIFDSFELERSIVDSWYPMCSNLRDYVLAIFENLPDMRMSQDRRLRLITAQRRVAAIREYEARGEVASAERELALLMG